MSEDDDLERLRQRKLHEMRIRLLRDKALKAEETARKEESEKPKDPEAILKNVFVGRALEVWEAAKYQYPEATKEVARALVTLIESNRLKEGITGEHLYWLFLQLRLPIRLETKIRIFKSGELKTIAEKLKEE